MGFLNRRVASRISEFGGVGLRAGAAPTRQIDHQVAFKDKGACTNQADGFFSRLRRAEVGTHHHIAGPYLNAYANEMTWREDIRRVPNGTQFAMVADLALSSGVSRRWYGCWQRAA